MTAAARRKPPPAGFAEIFVRFGWRGVETVFGSRTECNKRWICQCGGVALVGERRRYRERLRTMRGDG